MTVETDRVAAITEKIVKLNLTFKKRCDTAHVHHAQEVTCSLIAEHVGKWREQVMRLVLRAREVSRQRPLGDLS